MDPTLLLQSLVGQTITKVDLKVSTERDDCADSIVIHLSSGKVLNLVATVTAEGNDEFSAATSIEPSLA